MAKAKKVATPKKAPKVEEADTGRTGGTPVKIDWAKPAMKISKN